MFRTSTTVQTCARRMNLRGVPHSRNSANFQCYRLATTQATSFTEPNSTLLRPPQPLDENAAAPEVDAYLRADVKAMGSMLGRIISTTTTSTTSNTFDSVERLRLLAKEWRENGKDDETFAQMAEYAASLSNEEIQSVARAFTHFLALANTAEAHHRTRKNRTYMASKSLEEVPLALMDKRDSCGGVIPELLQRGGENAVRPSDLYESLCSQQVELVLTAHPTEVNKRTILQKKKTVLELLSKADEIRAGGRDKSYEASLLLQDLECQISSLWQSDEVARAKPSPQEEARRGMLVLESVLWEALPEFLEKLSYTMQRELGGEEYALPLTACPIKFSSWMGGDRDGNPNGKQILFLSSRISMTYYNKPKLILDLQLHQM